MEPAAAPLTRILYSIADKKIMPLSGTFELLPTCNFSCRMCYVRKTEAEVAAHNRKQMTLAQWLQIAEEACGQGMLYILLTGGEPLMWPDFWMLYERLVQMGLLVSINTNGSLIDEKAIERFKKLPPARINITLYGACSETYEKLCRNAAAFSKVKNAIVKLKEAGINVKLNCSLTPYNIQDMEQMAAFAQEHRLILDATPYMYPPIRRDASMTGINERFTPEEAAACNMKRIRLLYGEERYISYKKELLDGYMEPLGLDESCIDPMDGKVRCRAGKAGFWMTWDGYMMPCGMMPEPKADAAEKGFTRAWQETVKNSLALRTSSVCEQCSSKEICHSCAAMAYTETGEYTGIPVYLCQMVQEMKRIAEKELQQDKIQH